MSESDDALETLWSNALAKWDDDKAHAAVLEYALRTERLPDVAGRYRALKDDPEKGPMAKKRIDAIVTAATQLMFAQKTPPPPKSPAWLTLTVVAVCLGLLTLLTWALVFRPHAH